MHRTPVTVLIADDSGLFAVSVLMLTGSDAKADVRRAGEVGASAYVVKDQIAEALVATIRKVAASC